MEPSIYKPSIYKGAGIYKTGAEGGGGGGGEDWKYKKVQISGKEYRAIEINNQLWMADNLSMTWEGLGEGGTSTPSTPWTWWYDNDEATYSIIGRLYNWYAANELEQNKNSLIPGWRVPTKTDYSNLLDYIKNLYGFNHKYFSILLFPKRKSIDETLDIPNVYTAGVNEFGLNMYGPGYKHYGNFSSPANPCYWTCTEDGAAQAYRITPWYDDVAYNLTSQKDEGYGIRLIQDL